MDGSSAGKVDARRGGAEKRVNLQPLKKKVQAAEKRMAELTAELARYDRKLGDPGLYTRDPVQASIVSRERGQLGKGLEEALHAVAPPPEASRGGVLEKDGYVIIGGTKLRPRAQ